jgi:SH3 domain-containing YSC84-like protein 1
MKAFDFHLRSLCTIALLASIAAAAPVLAATQEEELVTKAEATLKEFRGDPKMDWLNKNLKNAKAVIIAPRIVKAGFVVGGSGGHVALVARDKETGKWVGPVFYSLATVSAGFQAGIERSEAVMLVMSEKALDRLMRTSFKLGGDASIAAGPTGVGAEASITTDIVSFARSKGIYGGLNIDGSVLKVDDRWNENFYKKAVSPADILIRRSAVNPRADGLLNGVAAATK